ncbi:acyl-CoA thioesterase-1 [Azomonas agilis]|uniref:Acyl-CoA thioesterase-1 n=1 Tax=Azomonas agilis TaxID=116849 RepID=A0A562J0Q6_9GAMM|nr:arylesterase [Azomonas agilis]TWH76859.1 acyl-CoA thioesterase-1 [Azomonas agilis]
MRKGLLGVAFLLLCAMQGALAGTLLVVGDSISAGFGLKTGQGWVSLLQERLKEQAADWVVVNASISGDTTAGGLSRLPKLLDQHQPEVVILELGGNDGLRGQALNKMQQNLATMIDLSQTQGASVLLLGMRLPPNLGVRYTQSFAQVFDALAEGKKVAYLPFLLERVWDQPGLMQSDGIHPTAQAQEILLDNVWPELHPLLQK